MLKGTLKAVLLENLGPNFANYSYVIGVSGGVDSIVLLHAASQVLNELTVLHFNHKTRGKASDEDEAFTRSVARKLGLKYLCAQRKGRGVSEAALRKERFAFLRREARKRKAFILLAHHLDDQLETFFLRLIRGAQLKGLMGMKERNGRVLRPFLGTPKADLIDYALSHELAYREDESNRSVKYFRNRVRHELLPVLFSLTGSHGGKKAFYRRFNALNRESQRALNELDRRYDQILKKNLVRTGAFDRLRLAKVPSRVLQSSHFLRRLFERIHYQEMEASSIKKIQLLLKKGQGRVSLVGNRTAEISCGFLFFQSNEQLFFARSSSTFEVLTSDTKEFSIRTFEAGDRYRSRKMKEEFLRRGVPRPERTLVPLALRRNTKEVLAFYGEPHFPSSSVKTNFPFSHI